MTAAGATIPAETLDDLLDAAREVARTAYCPYSNFRVGAAVSAGGKIFTGCNIENASYGLTVCAERIAIFTAISAGHRKIDAMALSCLDAMPSSGPASRMPCGACRQVIAEFAEAQTPIAVDQLGTITLSELLPHPFELDQPTSAVTPIKPTVSRR
jgi:cytidine deaminase